MNTEKTKDQENKTGCSSFGSDFKGFQEMFEKMSSKMGACCANQDGAMDCSSMKSGMTQMCCGPKTDETKTDSEPETEDTKGDSSKG